ncbi:hypothetical protein GCM10029976_041970 [Kribbella albertanoniae]|uniref:DUF998 domain-containing protein n=1 Tax=Kribbella albertanoniae TaxID=1266829 RepID=A0A4R4QEH0_9ACTN|nr:hypothetical protein [Kribbella albertanoniae]TDC33991.1 hypothetical protein E1261_04590 [Kribbella albertanoniae]
MKLAGLAGATSGVVGIVAGLVMVVYPAKVDSDSYSYPFEATGFTITQVALTIRDVGLTLLVAALWTAVGRSVVGRIGVMASALAMLSLAALEVVSIVVKDEDSVGAYYGMASFAIGLFMILAGVAVLRAKTWSDWRRYLPLATGIYVFVPMTPGILAGFVVEQLVIAGWMAVFALLGWSLVRTSTRRTT